MPTVIARNIKSLLIYLNKLKLKNKKIGLIPTMGALHRGHISLVEKANQVSDISIVTIFVNPMQFNNKSDLNSYPSTEFEDIKKLRNKKVDLIFIPKRKDIYPPEFVSYIMLKKYDNILCSKNRKNHFSGVATIIVKIFNLCSPTYAFFGEKDYQQLVIIKKLVADFNFNTKIISINTVRDENGLALSSRNRLLTKSQYQVASKMHNKIIEILKLKNKKPVSYLNAVKKSLISLGVKKIEYLEFRREDDLELINKKKYNKLKPKYRLFLAVYIGNIRLIDNIKINFSRRKL